MSPADLLADAFGRIPPVAERVLDGLSDDQLTWRAAPDANSIAWLIWHLTRVQDDHVADVAGTEQVYTARGYAGRFALPLDDTDIGYGHTTDQAGAVRAPAALLLDYLQSVAAATDAYVRGLGAADLDRVVDDSWDPPVTLGVRLLSVVGDDVQHVGQAAYVRGLLGPSAQ